MQCRWSRGQATMSVVNRGAKSDTEMKLCLWNFVVCTIIMSPHQTVDSWEFMFSFGAHQIDRYIYGRCCFLPLIYYSLTPHGICTYTRVCWFKCHIFQWLNRLIDIKRGKPTSGVNLKFVQYLHHIINFKTTTRTENKANTLMANTYRCLNLFILKLSGFHLQQSYKTIRTHTIII